MKPTDYILAPLIGSILAVIFARPKSTLDAIGRLGIGVFSGYYFTPGLAVWLEIDNPEMKAAIAAGLGLFGFFMVEAAIRVLKNINSVKDIKG